ncbi:MAG: hypothetical protein WBD01_11910 [Salaquimonas sp.]
MSENEISKLLAKRIALGLAIAAFPGTGLAADALEEITPAERMAVSQPNAKVDLSYIHYDFDGGLALGDGGDGYLLQGAVSVPVGQSFGLQIDGGLLGADLDGGDINAKGVGGHFFWRDPAIGLLGAYGHYVDYDRDITTARLGAELEVYNGQYSFEGFAGVDHLDTPIGDEDYFAADATIAWYVNDNFRVSAGVAQAFEQTSANIGMEMMVDVGETAPAFFANASFGSNETVVMAGLRAYFGPSKSLKARHREDDPAIGLFDNFGALGSCLNESNQTPRIDNRSARIALPANATYSLDGCDVNVTRVVNN